MAMVTIYPPGYEEVHWDMEEGQLVTKLRLILLKLEDLSQYEKPDVLEKHTQLCLHLADQHFMNHPSKKVQILIALCLADVLRIYAPDEPFSPEQMTGILTLFISQYEGLKNPQGPNFPNHLKLLKTLALIGAFNTCLELDDEEILMCSLFQIAFQTLTEENSEEVHAPMLQILSNLVSDDDVFLSTDVLMIILINIMEPIKSTKVPSYNLARDLLVNCHVPLAPCIRSFFKSILHERDDKHVQLDHDKIYKVFDVVTELINICSSWMLQDFLLQSQDTLNDSTELLCDISGVYSTEELEEVIKEVHKEVHNYKSKENDNIKKQFGLKEARVILVRIEDVKKTCPQMSNVNSPLSLVEKGTHLTNTNSLEDVPDIDTLSIDTTATDSPKRNVRKRPHQTNLPKPTIVLSEKSSSPPKSSPVPSPLLNDNKLRRMTLSLAFDSVKKEVPKISRNRRCSNIAILKEATKYIKELSSLESQLITEHSSCQSKNDVLRARLAQLDTTCPPEMISID